MSKLLPGLAIGLSLAAFPLASAILPALAQEGTVSVTIGGTFADELSAATGIPVGDLPATLDVPVSVAAVVCNDPNVAAGGTCAGVASAASLEDFLDDDSSSSSSEESSSEPSSSEPESSSEEPDNSAKAFAPGQLKQDGESAREYAPGQNKEDGESAKEHAPGQQKKNNNG
jgi:hypothetical protein